MITMNVDISKVQSRVWIYMLEEKTLRLLMCMQQNYGFRSLKEFNCEMQGQLFESSEIFKTVLFSVFCTLIQSSHLHVYTHTKISSVGVHTSSKAFCSAMQKPRRTFLLLWEHVHQMPCILLHSSSNLLNKTLAVPHRYLHCINPFCASGRCSGLLAFGSV